MNATVIIPTTGDTDVRHAIESVLSQTYSTICYVVCDGDKFKSRTKVILDDYLGDKNLKICYLPENVGANGFYGHRVYASFTHLVNSKYVLYLDQDNWLQPNHVESCVNFIEQNNLDWCYSLRSIYDKNSTFICHDNCESLGKYTAWTGVNHIDTNTYCLKTEIGIRLASVWHGGWGQDRVFYSAISQHFPNYDCTSKYTTNYRLGGNEGSVNAEFFLKGNTMMRDKHKGMCPWVK
jgi:glycosyltransferase involved in cell wall biosynthesis